MNKPETVSLDGDALPATSEAAKNASAPQRTAVHIPAGYYRSPMYPGMIFRQRNDCSYISLDRHNVSASTLRMLAMQITDETFAVEGKQLASEDASRYGSAAWSGRWMEYFEWRQSIGNKYYDEQERLYPPAENDNFERINWSAA